MYSSLLQDITVHLFVTVIYKFLFVCFMNGEIICVIDKIFISTFNVRKCIITVCLFLIFSLHVFESLATKMFLIDFYNSIYL